MGVNLFVQRVIIRYVCVRDWNLEYLFFFPSPKCRYLSYNASYPFPYSSTTDIFNIYIVYIIVNRS